MCYFGAIFIEGHKNMPLESLNEKGKTEHLYFSEPFDIPKCFIGYTSKSEGKIYSVTSNQCLCDFENWPKLFEILVKTKKECGSRFVLFLRFWINEDYNLREVSVDTNDTPSSFGCPEQGVVYSFGYSDFEKLLLKSMNSTIELSLQNNQALIGDLVEYCAVSKFGFIKTKAGKEFFALSQIEGIRIL